MPTKVIKTSLGYTVLSVTAAGVNFIYYSVISHLLTANSFGDVQLNVSFILLAGALFTSLNLLALFLTATGSEKSPVNAVHHLERIVIYASAVCSLVLVGFSHYISSALNINEPHLLYILAAIFVINIPAVTWLGTIQGNGQFIESGAINLAMSVSKIIFSYTLIKLGLGATGAMFGILLATFIALPLAWLLQKPNTLHFKQTFSIINKSDLNFLAKHKYLLYILISLVSISAIAALDVVFAKLRLSSTDAGYFSQISTVAKIPFFGTAPIALVLFEKILKNTDEKDRIVTYYYLMALAAGSLTTLLAPFVLKIIFGFKGLVGNTTIAALTFAYVLYSIFIIKCYTLIAEKNVLRLITFSSMTFCLTIFSLMFFGHSIPQISYCLFVSLLVSLLSIKVLEYTK